MSDKKKSQTEIVISRSDLPLSCPINQTWDGHPKVYLDIAEKKKVICPYCGNIYKLID
jgi:uncharacterized Zn-finger protein